MNGNPVSSTNPHSSSLILKRVQWNRARFIFVCVAVFTFALIVRTLHWQDNPNPPFHGMTGEYKAHAMVLVQGDVPTFLRGPNPPSNAHVIKHPPGYPLLMAAVYKVFGDRDGVLRFLHIVLDSLAAVLVFLIAWELFSGLVATMAGLLVAGSPQLAYHAVALLPDPLAAPPLLVAIWLLIRAYRNPRWTTVFAAGLMIGLSGLFRSNTLLLPLLICAMFPLLFQRGVRIRFAAALLSGFLLLIVPVTIRNALFFRAFVPLSLSAGITLVEGIGVYDHEKRFGLPDNDYLVSKWEATEFGRPDYLGDRFGVDGVERERYRMKRGLEVIRQNPFWFLKVMTHRALSMWRLARVELVHREPAVRHSLAVPLESIPSWSVSPGPGLESQPLRIESPTEELFTTKPVAVLESTDYLLRVPITIERGSVRVEVVDAQRIVVLASSPVLHPVNWLDLTELNQPEVIVDLPFVSDDAREVIVRLRNGGKNAARATLTLGKMEGYALGGASMTWTRPLRTGVRLMQRLFITALVLPFTLLGILYLILKRRWPELAMLMVVAVYYMGTQSALWTEFRYILSMHYFLFILTAVGFVWSAEVVIGVFGKKLHQNREL